MLDKEFSIAIVFIIESTISKS